MKDNTAGERLVRVETKIEALGLDLANIKDSIVRMEAKLQTQLDRQDARTWELWAKVAGLSTTVSIIITLISKSV